MKLSKTKLKEALSEASMECPKDIFNDALVSFFEGTLEIEGYERVQWTRFDPKDESTFPPRDEYIDIFIRSKEHEFRGVNKLTEFWLQRIVERWAKEVKYSGSVVYWRPLPPPPGKEAKCG